MAKGNRSRRPDRDSGTGDRKDRRDNERRDQPERRGAERSKRFCAEQVKPFENDFDWYNKSPALTESAARIPFPYRPGMKLPLLSSDANSNEVIPGVITINWVPTVGRAVSVTDPINVAAKEVYRKVRGAFSGSLDADAPDFIIYFVSLDSIFSYIAALKRVYRLLNTYSPDNRLLPEMVLYSMGLQYDVIAALQSDKTKLWGVINELVGMTRKFQCPNVFPMFARHWWLNDNVYGDTNSLNCQFYVLNQIAYYQFALQKTPQGVDAGGAVLVQNPFIKLTLQNGASPVDDLFAFGRQLINALAESDDAYTISGYLKRAYEGETEFFVDEMPQDQEFVPYYAEAVLRQIENAYTSLNTDWSASLFPISQDPTVNCVISPMAVPAGAANVLEQVRLNSRMDNPTVEEVVECSRLITRIMTEGTTSYVAAATEAVMFFGLYGLSRTSTEGGSIITTGSILKKQTAVAGMTDQLILCANWAKFDWAPALYLQYAFGVSTGTPITTLQDFHNVTQLTEDQLAQINRVCLYSEFEAFTQR